jgi:6,7-dimethyl-8-ribityllumazine synthase
MAGPRRGKSEKGGAKGGAKDGTKDGAKGARVLIVEARYYDDIADLLLAGAMKVLKEAGAVIERITVPGSLEVPAGIVIALDAAEEEGRPYDGVVALGCVIRGDTIHFEIVSQLSAQGLLDLSVARALPLGNGIVTVNTLTQALARARLEDQDKGGDAARAALALIGLKKRLGAR